MKKLKKIAVLLIKKMEIGSAVAVRLTKYTGKSKVFVHPKHFLTKKPWYIQHLLKKDNVLDLGSGSGQTAVKASKYAKKVTGVEIDDSLIEIAKDLVKLKKVKNVTFIKGNIENGLKFKDKTFDKVIFLDVLEHLVKRDQALKEIFRIIKPDGLMFIGVPNSETSWKKLQKSVGLNYYSDPDHKIEFSEKAIKALLKKHNFKIISFSYGPADTPLRPLFDIVGVFSTPLYRRLSDYRLKSAQRSKTEASGFEIIAQRSK